MAELFGTPPLDPVDREVLTLIEELRTTMRNRVSNPRRWLGSLRRMTLVRAVQGSNSIEGYNASLDDVAAVVDGEPTLHANDETAGALAGYRDAMTYVLQVAQDEIAEVDEGLLKALHFMMLKHDLTKSPGRWRPGYIGVRSEDTGAIVYEGPDADQVPELIHALIDDVTNDEGPVLVRAAMAHLNLVMIHPFRDGNGRMARCLQTLVLARDRIVAPVFSSIEEYLGRNTQDYYDVLAEVGQGAWNPGNPTRPWIRFCLTAHYRQAKTHLRRIQEVEGLWAECVALADAHRLPERTADGMVDATFGVRLRNASYRNLIASSAGEEISDLTASRDLKAMVDADLLLPIGETRGRHYVAAPQLQGLRDEIRRTRPPRDEFDPYLIAEQSMQLSLDDGS